MAGLVMAGLLVALCTPAFLRSAPGPDPLWLIMWLPRRIRLSIERIDTVVNRRPSVYDSWSRLAGGGQTSQNCRRGWPDSQDWRESF